MLERFWQRRKDDEGFTLIELMVVVLIIGILIAIALPTFLGARARAQDRAAQSNLRNGLAGAKTFFTDGNTYTGFDVSAAQGIEPSLTWAVGVTTTLNIVAINVSGTGGISVLLQTDSASGKSFCVADTSTGPGTVFGKSLTSGDFAAPANCTGGW